MENKDILKAIAVLADKTGRYHERLMAVERDNLRLEKELDEHKNGCQCNNSSENKDISFPVTGNEAEAECEACSA